MGVEIVHDEMECPLRPVFDQVAQEEVLAGAGGSAGIAPADRPARCRAECGKPVERAVALVAIGPQLRLGTPCSAATRDGLQWPHLVETDNGSASRGIAVQVYDGVFFTSKSGSVLSHHV